MLQLPPWPTWDALHPFIVHFPIALLLLSPLFILISAIVSPPKGKPYMITALVILLLGTSSLFLAVVTGHAASGVSERGGAIEAVLENHEDLAEETLIIFGLLCAILFGMLTVPRWMRVDDDRIFSEALPLAFVAFVFGGNSVCRKHGSCWGTAGSRIRY